MRPRARIAAAASALATAALLLAACGGSSGTSEKSVVLVGTDVNRDASEQLVRRMVAERARVREWADDAGFDGFDGAIRVDIARGHRISMALVPAWRDDRGRMDVASRTVIQDNTPSLHEIVHIEMPNGNRFLAEGLAVYLQTHLKGVPAFPNFGRDLHRSARPAARRADIVLMDGNRTPTRIEDGTGLNRRDAYLAAGSFVRYLIETHGMRRFRRLYALTPFRPRERIDYLPDRYRDVYGKDLLELAREWKAFVGRS